MEILKGYCAKVRGRQKWQDAGLQDELFALFKLAWLENARLLARRETSEVRCQEGCVFEFRRQFTGRPRRPFGLVRGNNAEMKDTLA